jgi:cobalamin biosynthesis Mg chelatase CobN
VGSRKRLRTALAGLLALSAALFALGAALERHHQPTEQAREASRAEHKPAAQRATTKSADTRAGSTSSPEAANGATSEQHSSSENSKSSEGSGGTQEHASSDKSKPSQESGGESSGEGASSESSSSGGESAQQLKAEGPSSERVFGVNTESTPLVIAAVAASVLLALLVWLAPDSMALLLAVVTVGLVAAVFDVREVVHQSNEGQSGVEAIAIVVFVLHLAVAACAAALLARRSRPDPVPT